MTTDPVFDSTISAWLEADAPKQLPDRVLRATFERTRATTQLGGWRAFLGRLSMPRFVPALGSAAVIVVVAALALNFIFNQNGGLGGREPTPSPAVPEGSAPQTSEPTPLPSEAPEVITLLNGFLEVRMAGEGAEEYMFDPSEVPLLYATSSGAPYDRAEFEPVLGIEWPYGYTAFKVRLFAGDTVVEQLLFWTAEGPPVLRYDEYGFATEITPTTENGKPLALEYQYFDGAMTVHAAHPWVLRDGNRRLVLIPEGSVGPTTDGVQRGDWDELLLLADPAWVGTDCQTDLDPVGAAGLADLIRSDPNVEASAPEPVTAGGFDGLMLDVDIAAATSLCMLTADSGSAFDADDPGVLNVVWDRLSEAVVDEGHATGYASGERLRLYLFDVPATTGFQILAVAIVAPESTFERAVAAAAPIVNSIEVNAEP